VHISEEGIKRVWEFHEAYLSDSLECDGATTAISTFLRNHQVDHVVKFGAVSLGEQIMAPHFWIEIGNKVIDFRLEMWFGKSPDVPHGVFNPENTAVDYEGEEIQIQERSRIAIAAVIGYNGETS